MTKNDLWKECVAFHGHECGGLAIGFQGALYAKDLLGLGKAEDEDIVAIMENDACGVDAIQVLLGTTAGKGNLLFHLTGKHAYSFYDRKTGKSVRLVLKPIKPAIPRSEMMSYCLNHEPQDLFEVKETKIALPTPAHIFATLTCSVCGEPTAEAFLGLKEGKPVCRDCEEKYSRFDV